MSQEKSMPYEKKMRIVYAVVILAAIILVVLPIVLGIIKYNSDNAITGATMLLNILSAA